MIGACRDLDKMKTVVEEEFAGLETSSFTPMKLDLASFESVRDFVKNVNAFRSGKKIDRLVCNAAVYQPTLSEAQLTEDGIEQQLQINFLSHFLLCSQLVSAE